MMISSVARVKFIKTKAIFRYHTKGTSNQFSSNSDHEIKSYSCSNSSTKIAKNEEEGKKFWVTKLGNKGVTKRGKRDFKSGKGLQIGAEQCYSTNVRLFTYLNEKVFSRELKKLNYDELW